MSPCMFSLKKMRRKGDNDNNIRRNEILMSLYAL